MPEETNAEQSQVVPPASENKGKFNYRIVFIVVGVAIVVISIVAYLFLISTISKTSNSKVTKVSSSSAKNSTIQILRSVDKYTFPGDIKNKLIAVHIIGNKEKKIFESELYLTNIDGSGGKPLFSNRSYTSHPEEGKNSIGNLNWSPKGNYLSWGEGGKVFNFIKFSTITAEQINQIKIPFGKAIWSPNEDRVMFLSSGKIKIYKLNGDLDKTISLQDSFTGRSVLDWLDENNIIFVRKISEGKWELVKENLESSIVESIIKVDAPDIFEASLSTDKTRLVYETNYNNADQSQETFEVKTAKVEKGKVGNFETLYSEKGNCLGPWAISISPKGNYVTYGYHCAEGVSNWIVKVEEKQVLSQVGSISNVNWKYDENMFTFGNGVYWQDLAVYDLDKKTFTTLTKDKTEEYGEGYFNAIWFPN